MVVFASKPGYLLQELCSFQVRVLRMESATFWCLEMSHHLLRFPVLIFFEFLKLGPQLVDSCPLFTLWSMDAEREDFLYFVAGNLILENSRVWFTGNHIYFTAGKFLTILNWYSSCCIEFFLKAFTFLTVQFNIQLNMKNYPVVLIRA